MFQHGEYVRQIGTGKEYRIVRTPGMARMMDQVSGEWVGCYIYINCNDPFSYVRPKDDFEGKFEPVEDFD